MTDYLQYKDNFKNCYEAFPDKKLFRLQFDDVTKCLQLTAKRQDLLEEIREAFSVDNPSAFFTERYGYRADNKLYAINKFGYFMPGLVHSVLEWIKTQYGNLSCLAVSGKCAKYVHDFMTPLKEQVAEKFQIANVADDTGRNAELKHLRQKQLTEGISEKDCVHPFEYRDYQEEAVKMLFFKGQGRGMIEIPTAGGKSFIIANYIWNMWKNVDRKMKFLLLVPNTQLVEQFWKDLIDYGYDPHILCKMRGGMTTKQKRSQDLSTAKVIITNRQFLFKNADIIPQCDALFCDEVHTTCADSTKDFIMNYDCKIKVGCTGTMPSSKYNMWKLEGMFSRVVYRENITDLQDRGFISKLKITLLNIVDKRVEGNKDLLFSLDTTRKYKPDEFGNSDIAFNDSYNAEHDYFAKYYKDLYKPVFEYLLSMNQNTLILFDRIEIGQNLFEYAKELYAGKKDVYYIDGSIDVKEREFARDQFEKKDGNLLIAQNVVMSTGVNIKRLTNIVFLTGSKSFSQVVQSIGRTLRLHFSKDEAHLIDCSWNFKYSQKHLKDRLKIYKSSYGKKYDEKIVMNIN